MKCNHDSGLLPPQLWALALVPVWIGLVIAPLALAQDAAPPAGGPPGFAAFDLDGDGLLTAAEFAQARAQRIAERSQQGYRMRNLSRAPAFAAIDRDGNGQIDREEFEAAQARQWRERQGQP